MGKYRKAAFLMVLMLVCAGVLSACNEKASSTNENERPPTESEERKTENEGVSQSGGTLTYGLDSEFKGLLDYAFYEDATDSYILGFIHEGIYSVNDNLEYEPNYATWETEDNKVYTFTLKKGVKWHNGEELTVHDWVFALETIAHPDYNGPRYVNVKDIVGAPAYHEGKADSIEGIEVIDDYKVRITFDKARVNNLENLWSYPMPKKAFEGIAVKDMPSSAPVRSQPVGVGPFKVTNVVPGEYVEMTRHEEYWQGEPKLDGVIVRVIDSSLTTGALKNGEIDVMQVHPTYFEDVQGIENIRLEKVLGLSYYYIGFRLGHWDKENTINVMDDPKYQNLKLRQAMYYAINRPEWVEAFFNGLGQPVNRPIPSVHWIAAPNDELIQYEYDPEKAKQLLDEAGYVDADGDGWREDPNGDPFVVNFGHYATGNPTYEARAKALLQYWQAIGLNAQFATGGLIEVNNYYDMLENSDEKLEVFYGGWSTGSDPDPYPLWGSDAKWNFPRWVNEESDRLLKDARDIEVVGTSREKRKALYAEWQKLFNKELPALPIMELYDLWALNKRVKGTHINANGFHNDLHKVYLEE